VTDDGSGTVDSALSTVLMVAVHHLVVGSQREERRDGEPAAQPDRQGIGPWLGAMAATKYPALRNACANTEAKPAPRDIPIA
jgi:hypothetical protein